MEKIRMLRENSLTFEEGCNLYLYNCRERNLRQDITVDCTLGRLDPMSNAFIQMSGVFAELELGMIRERVRSGMANATAKGVKLGAAAHDKG